MELTRQRKALLRSLFTRHGRRRHRLCVCEGSRAVGELLAARPELFEFAVATATEAARRPLPEPCFIVDEKELAALAGTVTPQGVLVAARMPEDSPETPNDPYLLALDRIGDPGNFGTICRTARAAGLTSLWYTAGSVDPYGDKAIRSAMGAQFGMKLREFPDLAALRARAAEFGYGPVYLSDPHEGADCFAAPELFDRTVLVIGSEAAGTGELAAAPKVTIPMPGGFESLNAAQAATILIFEAVRRARQRK